MTNHPQLNKSARHALQRGIGKFAHAVKAPLGSAGGKVIPARSSGFSCYAAAAGARACARRPCLAVALLAALAGGAHAVDYQWDGGANTEEWQAGQNWNPDGAVGVFNQAGAHRLNVNGAQRLVYKASEGTTVYANNGTATRGLVIGSGARGSGEFVIAGGSFSTVGSTARDVIGNNAGNTGILTIDGGAFIGTNAGTDLGIGGGPACFLNVLAGSATVANLNINTTTATINLNGGVLVANNITRTNGTGNLYFNGGKLRARQNNSTFINNLTGVFINAGGATIDTSGFDVTVTNYLRDGGGGGGLIKDGTGVLALAGSNTFTGPVTINGGTLALRPTTATIFDNDIAGEGGLEIGGTGSVRLGGTGTYAGPTLVSSGTLLLDGTISSNLTVAANANLGGEGATAGTLVFEGPGTLFFNPDSNGPNDHLRAASINATGAALGFAAIGSGIPVAGAVVMEAPGGITGAIGTEFLPNARVSLAFNPGATQLLANYTPGALVWRGDDPLNPTFWDNETTVNWFNSGTAAADVFVPGDKVLFDDSHELFSLVTVAVRTPVFPGGVTFDNDETDFTVTGAAIAGTTGLVKSGLGWVTLSNANTFSGTVAINAGTLVAQNNSALGSATAGTIITDGGTLDLGGTMGNNALNLGAEPIIVAGAGADGLGAIVNFGSNDQINALQLVTLADDTVFGGTRRWDFRNGTPVLDMGGFDLLKTGVGTISLVSAAVVNPGHIEIEEGTLSIQLASVLDGDASNTLTVRGGARLSSWQLVPPVSWSLLFDDGAVLWAQNSAVNSQNTWTGPVAIATDGTMELFCEGVMNLTGDIAGSGAGLRKTGGSAVFLSGTNTFGGPVTVEAGSIIALTDSALGDPAVGTTVANNGRVEIGEGVTVAGEAITINGNGGNFFGALQGRAGTAEWQGPVTVASALTRVGVNAGTFTVSGVIASGGEPYGLGLRPNNAGFAELVLTAANTYLGDTLIISGGNRVKLAGGDNRLPVSTRLIFGTSAVSGVLDLNGCNQEVTGLAVDSGTANRILSAAPATLTVDAALAPSLFPGAIEGQVVLLKQGGETLTLSGPNSYLGDTVVETGSLVLAAGGRLAFRPTANGITNRLSGDGSAILAGTFDVDLLAAAVADGNSWQLVTVADKIYEASFTVAGFEPAEGVWKRDEGAKVWTFDPATGLLSLAVTGGYVPWISGFGLALADQAPGADPDRDGSHNLLEFVLNGDPTVADAGILPTLDAGGPNFVFTYTRRDDSLSPETTQTFQYGNDLVGWTDIVVPAGNATVGAATITVTDGDPADTVQISIPKTEGVGGKLFGRLKVSN